MNSVPVPLVVGWGGVGHGVEECTSAFLALGLGVAWVKVVLVPFVVVWGGGCEECASTFSCFGGWRFLGKKCPSTFGERLETLFLYWCLSICQHFGRAPGACRKQMKSGSRFINSAIALFGSQILLYVTRFS
jgi:hypothetical protein